MIKKIKFLPPSLMLISFLLLPAIPAEAATLYMMPKSGELKVGQIFTLEIKVNTDVNSFNAAQATVNFPANLLEVKSIDSSPSASIFNFWLEGPVFSNADGKVRFIGGTANGISGKAISVLKINFIAKTSGEAPVTFSDAAVTAADGNGTNILSSMEVASFKISPEAIAPMAVIQAPIITVAPKPTLITRPAVVAVKLPIRPSVSVPFYPDEASWYNTESDFLAKWGLPTDVSWVNAVLDKNSAYSGKDSEGLFEGKVFSAIIKDGIWYLHVRFRNSAGWGPVADYRIAVDTSPPYAFKIDSLGGFRTDNPNPVFRFATSDGLSGMDHYEIRIDNGDVIANKAGEFKLPLQSPGKHRILIRAFDKAGNSIEDNAELEILPIESPVITFINQSVFTGEGGLTIKGTSIASTTILIALKDENGKTFLKNQFLADYHGDWQAVFDQPLKSGQYYFEIQAQDQRGALSFPVKSGSVKVHERPILTINGIEIDQFWFFIILIIILLSGFGLGLVSYQLWLARVEQKEIVAKRDFSNLLAVVIRDLDFVGSNLDKKDFEEKNRIEAKFYSEKAKQNLQKMEKYIAEEIGEISH